MTKKKSFSGQKQPPIQPEHRQLSASMASLDVKGGHQGRPRKAKEAPKPPASSASGSSHTSTPNFNGSRPPTASASSEANNEDRKRNEVRRSASNHGNRPSQGNTFIALCQFKGVLWSLYLLHGTSFLILWKPDLHRYKKL